MVKLKTVITIIGNITSSGLFLSPGLIFKNIVTRGVLEEEFNVFPYLTTLFNCLLWVFYMLPIINPGNNLLLAINGFGVVMEIIYLGLVIRFADRTLKELVAWIVIAEFLSAAALLAGILIWVHNAEIRLHTIGGFCVASGILMYGSTLPSLVSAWSSRSTTALPLALIVVGLVNTAIWLGYGIRYKDLYIMIQDGIGLALCTTQLTVYLFIRCRPRSDPTPA